MSVIARGDHMLDTKSLEMRYRPFPVGAIRPAMDETTYAECLEAYPDPELFEYIADVGHKYSLSEKYAARNYHAIINEVGIWREFHRWIKSPEFLEQIFGALNERAIDLGYQSPKALKRLGRTIRNWRRGRGQRLPRYTARFEFSMLPAARGFVRPHTDNPEKIVTLVISMLEPHEWNPDYGGGTDILRPLDEKLDFERLNDRRPGFEEFETVHTYDFVPNQAVVFAKTYNSWHAVQPMKSSDEKARRRSVTINIESS
jgi:hypothetical protein